MNSVPVCVEDFEKHAQIRLPKHIFEFYGNGADEELSLKRNVNAFKRLLIRPRFMRDVSNVDTSVSLLNGKVHLKFPICLSPTGFQGMAHPEGDCATAQAAAELNTIMVASSMSTSSMENIAKSAPEGLRWFQLFLFKNRTITEALIRRAENSGYKALVVTVDTVVGTKRRNDVRNSFALPNHLKVENFVDYIVAESTLNDSKSGSSSLTSYINSSFDQTLNWTTIDWLRTITTLPIILKGILTAEDAALACEHKVDGIIISNHGARALDSGPATIEALPEIVDAVKSRCDVYLDGGVRSGNDIFKALALGAKAVFVGRPYVWGLAYDGKNGVKLVMNMLKTELETTMALAGCKSLDDMKKMKNLIVHENYYSQILSKL